MHSAPTLIKLLDSFATKPGAVRADAARNTFSIQGSGPPGLLKFVRQPCGRGERAPAGNPLWAIPSRRFPKRGRPSFPPRVAHRRRLLQLRLNATAATGKKPAEPDRPQLSLVGTIAGGREGFGIFLDRSANTVSGSRLAKRITAGFSVRCGAGRPCSRKATERRLSRCRSVPPRRLAILPMMHRGEFRLHARWCVLPRRALPASDANRAVTPAPR